MRFVPVVCLGLGVAVLLLAAYLAVDLVESRRASVLEAGDVARQQAVDAAREKHIPVLEKTTSGAKVKVGSVAHPMEEKHYIEWIEVIVDGKVYREFLKPGDAPEAAFDVKAEKITAREYCNLHGLWKG